jgi:hypothetical protein
MATNPIQAQTHLAGVGHPVSRGQLREPAPANGIGGDLLDTPGRLPDRSFDSPSQASEASEAIDSPSEAIEASEAIGKLG